MFEVSLLLLDLIFTIYTYMLFLFRFMYVFHRCFALKEGVVVAQGSNKVADQTTEVSETAGNMYTTCSIWIQKINELVHQTSW